MSANVKLLLAGALLLLVLVLIVQNTEVVAVRFLLWDVHMSRVILIVLALVAGFAGGFVWGRLGGGRRRGGG